MNKEIEEMANDINERIACCGYVEDCKPIELAEKLYNADYHKTVWHRVIDGDLPKFISDLIIAIKCNDGVIRTVTGNYRLGRFNISDLGEIDIGKVVAWTELPKYRGEE